VVIQHVINITNLNENYYISHVDLYTSHKSAEMKNEQNRKHADAFLQPIPTRERYVAK